MFNNNPGVLLAKEINRVNSKIQNLIQSDRLNFDTFEVHERAYMVTTVCNFEGCYIKCIEFPSLDAARTQAAILTLNGKYPDLIGMCNNCLNSSINETICTSCNRELLPVYDDYPNAIKFCPTCM